MRLQYDFAESSADNLYTRKTRAKLFVHLKDPRKIQKGKRWSQTMYMYYLMNYKLGYDGTNEFTHKETIKNLQNKYILALDADVDFQAEDLKRVLHNTKLKEDVGIC